MVYESHAELYGERVVFKVRRFKVKVHFLAFALSFALFAANTAGAATQQKIKSPSCKTLRQMARVYMAFGQYTKAQPLAEQALNLAKTSDVPDSELAMCLLDLATLYYSQNNLSEAEEMCTFGLKVQKRSLYKNHPYIAYTLRTLGSIYKEQGKYDQAEVTLDEAMAIMYDSHTENDKALIPFWVDIASLHVAKRDFTEAESYYKKAINFINTSYGPNHLYTANVLGEMAKLYTLQERYDEAEKLIDQALATQERIYGPDNHLIAPNRLTKARICHAKGDYARSEELIEKALTAARKSGNTAVYTKLERNAEEIRTGEQNTVPVAKAVDLNDKVITSK
jgi:tetratricopeptide (TPR) repeat protein